MGKSKSALFAEQVSKLEMQTAPHTLRNTVLTLVEIRPEPNTKKCHVSNAVSSLSQGAMGICFAQKSALHNTKKKITSHLAMSLQTKKLLNFAVEPYIDVCGSKPTRPYRFWVTPHKSLKAI